MSDQRCKSCEYYRAYPFSYNEEIGDCNDPTKIIYDSNSNRANDEPETRATYDCKNHRSIEVIEE